MVTALLVSSLQAWFLVLLLASKRSKELPDWVLASWLALIGVHTGSLYLHHVFGVSAPITIQWNSAFPLLQGPFLFFYVSLITSAVPKLRAAYLLHLLPFLAYFLLQNPSQQSAGPHGVYSMWHSSVHNALSVWLLVSVPVYIVASLGLLRGFRRRLLATRSNVDRVQLRWLRVLVAGMGFVWIAVLLTVFLQIGGHAGQASDPKHLVFPALTLFVYAIGYFGFAQSPVSERRTARNDDPAPEDEEDRDQQVVTSPSDSETQPSFEAQSKYQKSGLGSAQASRLREELLALMEGDQPYLDPELTLGQLSELLGCATNHLSQVINELEGESFYEFVNRYRVETVATRLRDPAWSESTVLDIAFESGFGSKSTFNRAFRTRTGSTPSQYRR